MALSSKASICNLALSFLGQPALVNDPDDTAGKPNARRVVQAYDDIIETVLAEGLWSFARNRASLEADATAPDFGWDYRFPLPQTPRFLALVGLDPDTHGADCPCEIEDGWIVTDEPGPLKIVYIGPVDDPAKFEPNFAEALALKIAYVAAPAILNSQDATAELERRYQKKLPVPKALEARTRKPRRTVIGGDWLPRSTG